MGSASSGASAGAIGDDASTYVNLITGPRRDGETDGPKELHLIILDGGRLALRGTEFEEALNCIRCGACLYSCPMWRTVGGQAYGSPYSGPIGAVITPLLEGTSSPRASELPFLSSLCGASRCTTCWSAFAVRSRPRPTNASAAAHGCGRPHGADRSCTGPDAR